MIEVALKDCNAKSYYGNYFFNVPLLVWAWVQLCLCYPSMSIALSIANLQRNTYSNRKTFIVSILGTRQEMKIKKQNKIVSLCFDVVFVVFFSFVCLLSFCEFFGFLMGEHMSLFILLKNKDKKRFCVKGWGVGNNSCGDLSWFCYGWDTPKLQVLQVSKVSITLTFGMLLQWFV